MIRTVSYWLAEIGEKVILKQEFEISQYLSTMTRYCLDNELYSDLEKLESIKNLYAAAETVRKILLKAKANESK